MNQINKKEALDNPEQLFNRNFFNFTPLICALMVVLIHTYNVSGASTSISAFIISFFSHGLCTAAVPMFFFMSGWLFYVNADTIKKVLEKQKKRIFTVLIPFLAWSTFYYVFYFVVDCISGEGIHFNLFGFLKGVIFYEHVFPMWYMFQLCIFIALAPVVFYLLKNTTISLIILCMTALTGMFICGSVKINIGDLERGLFHFNFFAYYFAGCLFSKHPSWTKKLKERLNKIPQWIPIIAFIIFGFIESLFFDTIESFNDRCIVPLVFIAFLLLMVKICNTKQTLPKSFVSTMIIYGIHPFVGVILGNLVFSNIKIPMILAYGIMYISVVAVSYGIGYIMKLIKPIYFVFSGNR